MRRGLAALRDAAGWQSHMIITITLNPAVDETVEVDRLVTADTNRVVAIRRDIGGKGVNVARVLRELGYEPLAMGFAPGRFGGMIEEQLTDEGIGCDFIPYPGETRTNINIVDRSVHQSTVLAAPGPVVPPEAIDRLSRHLHRRIRRDTCLVFAGSMPPGMEVTFHAEALDRVQALGAMSVLDADGPVVEQVFALGAQPTILSSSELVTLVHGLGVPPGHLHVIEAHPRRASENTETLRRAVGHPGLSVVIAVRECVETVKRGKREKPSAAAGEVRP